VVFLVPMFRVSGLGMICVDARASAVCAGVLWGGSASVGRGVCAVVLLVRIGLVRCIVR
jgi:hypothetical protein